MMKLSPFQRAFLWYFGWSQVFGIYKSIGCKLINVEQVIVCMKIRKIEYEICIYVWSFLMYIKIDSFYKNDNICYII